MTAPPPTWPSDVPPTPEEWLDRFLACDRIHQLHIASRILSDQDAALGCFIANHRGHIRGLEFERIELLARLRAALPDEQAPRT